MDERLGRQCALCGADGARSGETTITAGRNGIQVQIRGVPAVLCSICGDAAVHGPLAVELSDAIERIIRAVEQHPTATVDRAATV